MQYGKLTVRLFKKQQGFTLAEVLITLVIIGVIAAMTVPSFMQSTEKKETIVALKKAHSVIGQALQKMTYNNGYAVGDYDFLYKDSDTFIDEMEKVVNVVKTGRGLPDYRCLNDGDDFIFAAQKYIITSDGMIFSAYKNEHMAIFGLTENDERNALIS